MVMRHTSGARGAALLAPWMLLEIAPVVPGRRQPQNRAGHRLERGADVELVPADDLEAGEHEPDDDGTDDCRQERADDPTPELVWNPDREVPEGDAHHDPDEQAHR